MKALITGASSGIGREFARLLHARGYELILVARRENRLKELSEELGCNARIIELDLSKKENCYKLYDMTKDDGVDLLINNAGFAVFGEFTEIDLERELEMIDVNIVAVDILMKLFLRDFEKRNSGRIFNVASAAAFMPGPLLSTYYATKAYVLRLTEASAYELKRKGSAVYVGAFCPGPVDTEFNQTAGVNFSIKGLDAKKAADYALKKMFAGKVTIVAGTMMRIGCFFTRLMPKSVILPISYSIQRRKDGR